MQCNIPKPFDKVLMQKIFSSTKTICFVGLSPNTLKTSYEIAAFAQNKGFNIIPVHPKASNILGKKVFASLAEINSKDAIDMLYIFRRSEFVQETYKQAKHIRSLKSIWLPQGVIHDELGEEVQKDGLNFIQDQCLQIVYKKLY